MAEPHSTTAQGTRSQVPRFRSLLHRQQQREVTALGLPAASTAPSQGGLGELTQSGTQHHRAHRKGPCPGPPRTVCYSCCHHSVPATCTYPTRGHHHHRSTSQALQGRSQLGVSRQVGDRPMWDSISRSSLGTWCWASLQDSPCLSESP